MQAQALQHPRRQADGAQRLGSWRCRRAGLLAGPASITVAFTVSWPRLEVDRVESQPEQFTAAKARAERQAHEQGKPRVDIAPRRVVGGGEDSRSLFARQRSGRPSSSFSAAGVFAGIDGDQFPARGRAPAPSSAPRAWRARCRPTALRPAWRRWPRRYGPGVSAFRATWPMMALDTPGAMGVVLQCRGGIFAALPQGCLPAF